MKKLLSKIHCKLYLHYSKKARKYFHKIIGAGYYILWSKRDKLTKEEKNYMKNDINALYGFSCYADTDSVKR